MILNITVKDFCDFFIFLEKIIKTVGLSLTVLFKIKIFVLRSSKTLISLTHITSNVSLKHLQVNELEQVFSYHKKNAAIYDCNNLLLDQYKCPQFQNH